VRGFRFCGEAAGDGGPKWSGSISDIDRKIGQNRDIWGMVGTGGIEECSLIADPWSASIVTADQYGV
jgi:hypothetical protein